MNGNWEVIYALSNGDIVIYESRVNIIERNVMPSGKP